MAQSWTIFVDLVPDLRGDDALDVRLKYLRVRVLVTPHPGCCEMKKSLAECQCTPRYALREGEMLRCWSQDDCAVIVAANGGWVRWRESQLHQKRPEPKSRRARLPRSRNC